MLMTSSQVLSAAITVDGAPAVTAGPPIKPGPGEVVLDVGACGVCGSDLHMLSGGRLRPGAVLGHEISGTIAAVGVGVAARRIGTPVVVRPLVPCGTCSTCRAAGPHLCADGMRFGIGLGRTPGGFAQQVVVDASATVAIPPDLDFVTASLAEPLAVALHAIALAERALYLSPGEGEVVVVGGGSIGMLVALALRALDQDDVILVEPGEGRAAHAASRGIRVGTPASGSARLVFECAGHPSATAAALDLAAPQATVVLTGMLYEPVALPQLALILKQITVTGVFGYRHDTFDRAVGLLASGAIRAADVVTDVRRLDELPDLIAELRRPGTAQVKAVVRP